MPPPSPPLASTPVPSTAPPTVDLAASLRAALAAYFDALYAAGLDPGHKTEALGRLMSAKCACRQTLTVLRDEARAGRYLDYRYTLRDVAVIDADARGGDIKYTVDQSAGAERAHDGHVVERFAASTSRYTARFVRSGDRWLLDRLTEFR